MRNGIKIHLTINSIKNFFSPDGWWWWSNNETDSIQFTSQKEIHTDK